MTSAEEILAFGASATARSLEWGMESSSSWQQNVGPIEFQRGDDNRIRMVWVVVLECDFEFVGVGEAGRGVLGIVGMNMGRSGGRGEGVDLRGPYCL
jgi:hypothetical protein